MHSILKFHKKLFLLGAIIVTSFATKATHISGGDLDVQWITGNDYRVTLKLFRDCANAGAGFDNSVTITVRENGTNTFITSFTMSRKDITRLTLGDECFTPPSSVCMEEGFYSTTVTLSNRPNGVYFAWERCCRSPLNLNLVRDQAMVFYARIPDPALKNSSPKFGNYPSNGYMCINETNYFQFNVSDVDGDQLVYSLITPLRGSATGTGNPVSTTAGTYPYAPVVWQNPYSLSNIVGGTPNMSIDPTTGVITCKPVTQGAFTFAILVEEYRNGVKIGEIIRDIQFFALNCQKQVASINQTPIDDDTALEGCIKASFKFELSKTLTKDTTVCFEIKGNATNGVDYAFVENCITIPAGQTSSTIIIDAKNDGLTEGREDIYLIYNPIPCVEFVKDTVFLYIDDPQEIDYTLDGINLTCNEDFSGQIDAEITGGYPPYVITVTTDSGNGIATDYTSADLPVSGLPAGTYLVEIDDIYGCAGAAEVTGAIYDTGPTFLPDGNGNVYTTTLSVTGMSGTTVTSADDIVSVCLNMEHSFLGDVQMRLIAPDGTELVLKQRNNANDGNSCDLGEPVAKSPKDGSFSSNTTPGIGYDYCFTATPTYLTMVEESANYTRTHTDVLGNSYNDKYLPAGSYTPFQSFDNLIGVPLNGDWTIWVRDHLPQDNGWIFNWSISFRSGGSGDIITLTQPDPIDITLNGTVTKASCNGTDGGIDINVSGDFPPYTYLWSNGATTQDLTGVAAGSYTVTVTDNKLCTNTATFDVSNATGPVISASVQHEQCVGSNDGAIDASFTGTITSILWSNGATTEDVSGLAPGTYSVEVIDNSLCKSVQTFTINPAQALFVSGNVINENCGDKEGEIYIDVLGGAGGYTYLWSNGKTTQNITDLQQGTYTVIVTDANNCSTQKTFSVINLVGSCTPNCDLVINSANITPENCGNSAGSISLSIFTSNAPHNVLWSNGMSGDVISGLSAGSYTATITDIEGCEIIETYTVTNNSGTLAITNPLLTNEVCGKLNGSIDITSSGGNGTYTYLWSNGAVSQDLTNISEGTYSLTLTDGLGCSTSASFTIINEVDDFSIILDSMGDEVCGNKRGFINISIVPSGSYAYSWSNGSNSEDLSRLSSGTYGVTVSKTTTGCKVRSPEYLINNSSGSLTASIFDIDNELCSNSQGSIDISVSGGNSPYQILWSNGDTNEDLENIPEGTYSVSITDNNGCLTSINNISVFNDPGSLVVSPIITYEICNNNQGSISLNVRGETNNYSVVWSSGQTTKDISALSSGSYTYTVTDQAGCTLSSSAFVGNDAGTLVVSSINVTDATCGVNNGAIDISVTGGNGVYSYAWSNGATSQDLTAITNGAYTVEVSDGAGCSTTESIDVKGTLSLTSTITDDLCGQGTGAITINVTGGSALQYTWSNSSTSKDILNLVNGSYSVNVTSFEGCTLAQSFTVNNDPACNRMCIDSFSDAPSGSLFDSGGGGGNYGNNENCGFLIEPFCAQSITISFESFRTESNVDFLVIYEGTDNTGTMRLRASGTSIPASFTVSSGSVFVQFLSDISTVNSGFKMNWTSNSITNLPVANFNASDTNPFVGETVNFTDASTDAFTWSWDIDNDGTEDYNTQNISHVFTAAGSYDVTLTVTNCNGSDTHTVTIVVQDRPIIGVTPTQQFANITACSQTSDEVFTITNTGGLDLTWSISSSLFVATPSSGTIPAGGFVDVTFTVVAYDDAGTYNETIIITSNDPQTPTTQITITTTQTVDCGGLFCFSSGSTDATGILTDSGAETSNYGNDENCTYLIEPSCTETITLSFTAFDVVDPGDTLFVYDGIDEAGILLLEQTGNTIPSDVTALSGKMFVKFVSDVASTSSGYIANWTSTPKTNGPVANFSVSGDLFVNEVLTFTNTTTGNNTSWQWNFGDGSAIENTENTSHVYTTEDCFDVELVVSNADGCSSTITKEVCVTLKPEDEPEPEDEPQIFAVFPNPSNGLVYVNLASKEFEVIIYNSIGERVNYGINKINDYQYILDITEHSGAVYFIRINGEPFKIVKIN
jgi:PKD repeat protein/subtilisin-like proprotein convertase family protein